MTPHGLVGPAGSTATTHPHTHTPSQRVLTQPSGPAASAAPARLDERLDELKYSGGCRARIDWSSTGTIAAISPDGRSVGLSHFWADPASREWQLSSRIPVAAASGRARFCHVEWNPVGQTLAVVEESGVVRLFSAPSSSRGHLIESTIHPVGRADRGSRFDPVVLLHWLPVIPHHSKTTVLWTGSQSSPTADSDDPSDWKYDFFNHYPSGPTSPFEGTGSLVVVYRSGTVGLLYQASAHDWVESAGSIGRPDAGFVHVAISPRNRPNRDPFLVLAADDGKVVRLFEVRISWPSRIARDRADAEPADVATLSARCVFACPLPGRPAGGMITHFRLLAAEPQPPADMLDGKDADADSALVVCFHRPGATVMATWDVGFLPGPSSPDGRTPAGPGREWVVTARESRRMSGPVISLGLARFESVLAVCLADGTVEFRDRQLGPISPRRRPESIRVLADVGFVFPRARPDQLSTDICMSPNGCVVVNMDQTGDLVTRKMECLFGPLAAGCVESAAPLSAAPTTFMSRIAKPQVRLLQLSSAIPAAIALEHSRACVQSKSPEDLFAVLAGADRSIGREFTRQALVTMMLSLDYTGEDSIEQMRGILRVVAVYRILGGHHTLQLGRDGARTADVKATWVVLNLRMVLSALSSMPQPPGPMRVGLAGPIRYTLDLVCHVLIELEELSRALEFEFRSSRKPGQAGQVDTKNPADVLDWLQAYCHDRRLSGLLIVLCSLPRTMLVSAIRVIRTGYGSLIRRARDGNIPAASDSTADLNGAVDGSSSTTGSTEQAWQAIHSLFSCFPVSLNSTTLIDFFSAVDASVRMCYESAPVDRSVAEREMIVSGTIPAVLYPAVKRILAIDLPKLLGSPAVDRARLYSVDLSSLGLDEDGRTRARRESAMLAMLPLSLCRTFDVPDGGRANMARLGGMYPAATSAYTDFLTWQRRGGPAPALPDFPLRYLDRRPVRKSGWIETEPVGHAIIPPLNARLAAGLGDDVVPGPNGERSASRPNSAGVVASGPMAELSAALSPVSMSDFPDGRTATLKRKRSATIATGGKTNGHPAFGGHPSMASDRLHAADDEYSEPPVLPTDSTRPVRQLPAVPFIGRLPHHHPIDCALKHQIVAPAPMRRCVRCGSLSEDLFWVISSSARDAVARNAAAVAAAADDRISSALKSTSSDVRLSTKTTGKPEMPDDRSDPATFFMPPRTVSADLMMEHSWMVHANRTCVCTGEWAKII